MGAVAIPLRITQAADFSRQIVWRCGDPAARKLVDLTGWSAELEARVEPLAPVVYAIGTTPTAQGSIVLGGTLGTIDLASTFEETAQLPPGAFVYLLTMIDPFRRRRPFCGSSLVIVGAVGEPFT